ALFVPISRHLCCSLTRQPDSRGEPQLSITCIGWSPIWLPTVSASQPRSYYQAAIWLDSKRIYMDMRPDLRGIYGVVKDLATFGPMVGPLGFAPIPDGSSEFEGVTYHIALNDFGPASIDGWLSRLIGAELLIEDDPILDVAQRQLVLDGRRVDLTRLEFDVFSYLSQRPGKVVERSSLLHDVWGYDYAGGSNVIETVILGLRRKLGARSRSIETVRGLGCRYIATA
ncbi:MAG: winged helix-turn-helix domain-containing protein, partial [Candidatus Limnocylindria bacterium]